MKHTMASKLSARVIPRLRHRWTESDFCQLYPEQPQIKMSPTFFVVSLNYRGNLLKVKLATGIQNRALKYLFHLEIYRFLLDCKDDNPLYKTAQVVGFESCEGDTILDYQIALGQGVLRTKTSFNCLEYVAEGRLRKYKICRCLAIGGFSKVYLVRSLRDGHFYAMKVMQKSFITQNQKESIIENQKAICSMLSHPFIVKLNHCFETQNFVCFVMDFCPGGELFYYLRSVKRLSQEDARFFFVEILYGMMYLHKNNIIYRDLKPENLLINYDGHIKIADFGLSKHGLSERSVTYSFCGSTEYMPPQMILREGHSYGVDFYTLGALLYELITGLPPFYSRNQQQLRNNIVYEELTFPDHLNLSNEIVSLLSGLLVKNPKQRIGSIKGLREILFHPWIGKINAETVLSKRLNPPYIPSLDQFNFDCSELGEDQASFTATLLADANIPPSKESLFFKNIEFLDEPYLRPEVKAIYDNYVPIKELRRTSSDRVTRKSSSSRSTMKRQQNSPYVPTNNKVVRHNSLQKLLSPAPKREQSPVGRKRGNLSSTNVSIASLRPIYGQVAPQREVKKQTAGFLKKKKAPIQPLAN